MTLRRSEIEHPGRRGVLAGGAALLALGACGGASGQSTASPADEGDMMTVDGVDIHFERFGEGPPVVLIHGASGNLRDWTFRAAPEIARSHTVVAFDRPGHGLSGLPAEGGTRLSVQAALMRGALARIGIDRATVVGHSYGGSVALAWALDAPETVSGLMLLAAPSFVWPGGVGLTNDLLAAPLLGSALAHIAPAVVSENFAAESLREVFAPQEPPEGYLDHLRLDLILQPKSLRANARQLTALKEQVASMSPRYGELAMPLEILHGTADETVSLPIHSIPLDRAVPQSRFTPLEGMGHMLHHVALPAVLAALDRLERA